MVSAFLSHTDFLPLPLFLLLRLSSPSSVLESKVILKISNKLKKENKKQFNQQRNPTVGELAFLRTRSFQPGHSLSGSGMPWPFTVSIAVRNVRLSFLGAPPTGLSSQCLRPGFAHGCDELYRLSMPKHVVWEHVGNISTSALCLHFYYWTDPVG